MCVDVLTVGKKLACEPSFASGSFCKWESCDFIDEGRLGEVYSGDLVRIIKRLNWVIFMILWFLFSLVKTPLASCAWMSMLRVSNFAKLTASK